MLKEYACSQVPLLVHGRTAGQRDPLTLFWTASGFELRAKSAELWVELEADYGEGSAEIWVSTRVNGAWVSRQMLNRGRQWLCLFRGRNPEEVKEVRLWKDTQAMPQDPECLLQVRAFRCDGEFLPVSPRERKLEFIGDSITSGEGDIGAKKEEDWVPMLFCAENNYAVMTAYRLNADLRVLSQCGWGVVCGWNNDPAAVLPPYYTQVCGLLTGERNRALGAQGENDFSAWQPDAVIINLGTNDCGAFSQPPFRNPETGELFASRTREDGTFEPEDLLRLQRGVKSFLKVLRRRNPNALLLWAYGMLGGELSKTISAAVEEYAAETGDERAFYLQMQDHIQHRGARNHPGRGAHVLAAEELSQKLCRLLSWPEEKQG